MEFTGKVALITGAGGGIGRQIALDLAADGADIAIIDVKDDLMAETKKMIEELGRRAIALNTNVLSDKDVEAMVGKVIDYFGRIDIVVNNVGGSVLINKTVQDKKSETNNAPRNFRGILDIEEEDWDDLIKFNLYSVYYVVRHTIPHLIKTRGKIVNLASKVARTGGRLSGAAYVAGKAGVVGLTKQLAMELAQHGICCNAVAPGMVATDRFKTFLWAPKSEQERENILKDVPLKRLGEPKDIAGAVWFLASSKSDYVTGTTMDVNGGWYIPT
jgi:3-oxoacyl-[acyl-carrier protein] reductase